MGDKSLEKVQDELKWVRIREEQNLSFLGRLKSKGIVGFLVPAGCIATTGILCTGLYHFGKRNSRTQQFLMRSRVLVQGLTIAIAMIGIIAVPLTQNKSK